MPAFAWASIDRVEVGPQRHVALGDADVVEVDLALVEGALAHLVERVGALHARQIEGHEEDRAALEPLALVQGAEEHRDVGDRPVRDPGRLLPLDHVLIALLSGDAVRLQGGIAEVALGEGHGVAAVVGLGQRPAADRGILSRAEARDQRFVAGLLDPGLVEPGEPQGDREPHVAPGELLVDDGHEAGLRKGLHLGVVHERSQAQLVVLLEDLPQRRIGRDHVGRVDHAVELRAGRAHDLRGELVRQVADCTVLFGQIQLDVDRRHARFSQYRRDFGAVPAG
jgi:hypothetical protein